MDLLIDPQLFPSRARPKSLQDLTISRSGQLVFQACERFTKLPVLIDEGTWLRPILEMNRYYIRLARPLWRQICSIANIMQHKKAGTCNIDCRIIMAAIFHENMSSFSYRKHAIDFLLTVDAQTIRSYIPRCINISYLDLSGMSLTDYDMILISQVCSRTLRDIVLDTEPFSDVGVMALKQCTNLQTIHDNNRLRNLEVKQIIELFSLLRSLTSANCHSMGSVLVMMVRLDMAPIALERLEGWSLDLNQVAGMTLLCPNLHSLILIFYSRLHGCLNILANSSLSISHLHLIGFKFDDDMRYYLTKKGKSIRRLYLFSVMQFDEYDLDFIGRFCPNIIVLDVRTTFNSSPNDNVHRYVPYFPSVPIFKNLTCLSISNCVKDNGDLIMCLAYASNISVIDLSGMAVKLASMTDANLSKLLSVNKMASLSCLKVNRHCSELTILALSKFYKSCPELRYLLFSLSLQRN